MGVGRGRVTRTSYPTLGLSVAVAVQHMHLSRSYLNRVLGNGSLRLTFTSHADEDVHVSVGRDGHLALKWRAQTRHE